MKAKTLLICLIGLLVLIPFAAATSHATVDVVCFDGQFIRGAGKPITELRTFPGISGPATVKLWNGGAEDSDAKRVSSSTVTVNGNVIFGPSNFNQNITYLEETVMLKEGDNNLEVLLKSKPGGKIWVEISHEVDADGAAYVDSEGGVVEVTDPDSPIHGTKLTFPVGSLDQNTLFSVKYDALHDSDDLMARPIIVDHPDIQLHKDVILTLPLPEVPTEDTTLLVMVFDDELNGYVPEGIVVYVLAGDTLAEFQVSHLSAFSLAKPLDLLSTVTSICAKLGQTHKACFPISAKEWICQERLVTDSDSWGLDCMGRCGAGCPDDGPECGRKFRYTRTCFWHDACQRYNLERGTLAGLTLCENILTLTSALNDCMNAPICTNARDVCGDGIDNNNNDQIDEGCDCHKLEYRYPISGPIGGIGLSPNDSTLYVAYWTDTWSDKVEWYSTEAPYNLIDYVAYGRCHEDVAVSANNRYIFATTYYSNNVSRFDLWNSNAQTTRSTTSWPQTIALSPDRSKMVVFSGMDGRSYDMVNDALHIFDISNGNFYELYTVNLSDEPAGNKMAFTDNGGYGYFLTRRQWNSDPAKLHEVSMSSPYNVRSVPLPSQACSGIALADNTLYVADYRNPRILVYDRQTLTPIGGEPWRTLSSKAVVLAIPPDKSRLYALLPDEPNGGALEVFNLSNGNRIGGYEGLGGLSTRCDIEFNSDGSKVYISGAQGAGVLVLNVTRGAMSQPVYQDDFEDGVIDTNLWVWGGGKGGVGGAGSGGGQWYNEEIIAADGYLQARATTPGSANTYGSQAWMRTKPDFNDGRDWIINFKWEPYIKTVGQWHADYHLIEITDGRTDWSYGLYTHPQHNILPGTQQLYLGNGQDFSPTTWSIVIDASASEATLYEGPDGTGTIHSTKQLNIADAWYVRFVTTTATSAGYPAKDCRINLYDFTATEN